MSRISILCVGKELTSLPLEVKLADIPYGEVRNKGQGKLGTKCDRINYSLLTAKTEITGLELVQQHSPHIVICELSSSIDGYSLLEQIRRNQDTSVIPVIFLSNTFDPNQHRKAMEMGADDILFAPYSQSDLNKAITARLTRHNLILKQSEQKLEQLRHNIATFLPHEIRTALTGIIAGTELLLNSTMPLEPCVIKELLGCINLSGKRLSRLAHNFLLYSELKTLADDQIKIQDLQNQQTDSVCNSIAQISVKQAQHHHRQDDLILDLQETSINISPFYLMKLVEELTDNACKFSNPGTPIKIRSRIKNNYLFLSICDHGRGMTSQQIQQIGLGLQFERAVYEQQGFGLGLAIAKDVVRLHGGNLQISSIPQKSTTVTLSFPIPKSSLKQQLDIVSSPCPRLRSSKLENSLR
ncbi:MAG: hybrid sensor histidine kinase/response regulator [Xenococcaceae cyanobacterium MO_167.B52]|nr:hybrid sensor histidine kinase/response regulator [Xenococcaceae cyanobacterium MO_167.B52]